MLHGDPELDFGPLARQADKLHKLFPGLFAEVNPLLNAVLPGPTEKVIDSRRGSEVQGTIPDLTNRAIHEGTGRGRRDG
jgi:hypothetical protein